MALDFLNKILKSEMASIVFSDVHIQEAKSLQQRILGENFQKITEGKVKDKDKEKSFQMLLEAAKDKNSQANKILADMFLGKISGYEKYVLGYVAEFEGKNPKAPEDLEKIRSKIEEEGKIFLEKNGENPTSQNLKEYSDRILQMAKDQETSVQFKLAMKFYASSIRNNSNFEQKYDMIQNLKMEGRVDNNERITARITARKLERELPSPVAENVEGQRVDANPQTQNEH